MKRLKKFLRDTVNHATSTFWASARRETSAVLAEFFPKRRWLAHQPEPRYAIGVMMCVRKDVARSQSGIDAPVRWLHSTCHCAVGHIEELSIIVDEPTEIMVIKTWGTRNAWLRCVLVGSRVVIAPGPTWVPFTPEMLVPLLSQSWLAGEKLVIEVSIQ